MANKKKNKAKNKIKNKNTGKKESKSAKSNKNREESVFQYIINNLIEENRSSKFR